MNRLDNPSLESFTPQKAYSVLGIDYLRLKSSDGVALELTDEGVQAADQSPVLAGLLERMGAFIAEHKGYKDVVAVKKAEPGDIMMVADSQCNYHGGKRLASVYRHHSAPEAVIKAFDYDKRSAAPMQFYGGAWLQRGLAAGDDNVRSPRQLAMFSAAKGKHKTTVMDHMPGTSLSLTYNILASIHGSEALEYMFDTAEGRVRKQLSKGLGSLGLRFANDVAPRNILVDTEDPKLLVPEEIINHDLSLIDQPMSSYRGLAVFGGMRALSAMSLNG